MRRTFLSLACVFLVAAACDTIPRAEREARRSIPALRKQPAYRATPLRGVFRFRDDTVYVWAVLDRSTPDPGSYDILYLDLDADGDIAEAGERFVGAPPENMPFAADNRSFEIGSYRPPGSDQTHTDFSLLWRSDGVVAYKMKWRGERVVSGGYGEGPEDLCRFSPDPSTAPVFTPGRDRPFRFQSWMSEAIYRDKRYENPFQVFMGYPGLGAASFSSVDDKLLPAEEYVLATLLYRDTGGNLKKSRYRLANRC